MLRKRLIQKSVVTVYTTYGCNNSKKVKDFLRKQLISFKEIDLTGIGTIEINGQNYSQFPLLMLDSVVVGDYEAILNLHHHDSFLNKIFAS